MSTKDNKKYVSAIPKEQVFTILINDIEDGKQLEISDVDTFCRRLRVSSDDTTWIIHQLEDKNLIKVPKGFSSMSPLQKSIHRFINDDMLAQLSNNGKAQLIVSEEDLKSLTMDKDRFYVLNKKGDLIKPSCNNTNITQKRLLAKTKENMEKLQASK